MISQKFENVVPPLIISFIKRKPNFTTDAVALVYKWMPSSFPYYSLMFVGPVRGSAVHKIM